LDLLLVFRLANGLSSVLSNTPASNIQSYDAFPSSPRYLKGRLLIQPFEGSLIAQRKIRAAQQSVHLTGGIRPAKMRGFNAQAFFGTISIVHARPPASNAHRWAFSNRQISFV
jgi:hypothetical protein